MAFFVYMDFGREENRLSALEQTGLIRILHRIKLWGRLHRHAFTPPVILFVCNRDLFLLLQIIDEQLRRMFLIQTLLLNPGFSDPLYMDGTGTGITKVMPVLYRLI